MIILIKNLAKGIEMKKAVGIMLGLTLLSSCGKRVIENNTIVEKQVDVTVSQDFEGMFYLSNNSYIEMYQSGDKILVSRSLLTTTNPQNTTFGELPRLSGTYELVNSKIRVSKNVNYLAGNDIEEDVSGSDILGQRRTDITIVIINGKVHVTYEIYANKMSDNINYIVARRELVQE